nr:hypothetical protein [uncultured Methanoregula sp.]
MVLDRFTGRAKMIIAACCILLIVASALFVIGFESQAAQKKHNIQLHLEKAAGRMAGEVNGDGLLRLAPGDEGSPRYLGLAHALYNARQNDTFLVTSYILRVDNGSISYVVHDDYLKNGPGPDVARIGDLVTMDKPVILEAANGSTVYSPDIYTSKWGSYISGYAPVRDSNGTVVGVLGVDETADMVFDYETYQFYHLIEIS